VLIEDASRFVLEAQTIVKRSFQNVDNFFNFYNLDAGDQSYYRPQLDRQHQMIRLNRVFPFGQPLIDPPQKLGPKEEESTLESHSLDSLVLDQRTLKDLTIVAYFNDPVLPLALKEVINSPCNKELLRLYEASLPSWTVVLAQYGYYKPWFRFAVRYVIFIASLITMVLGFWDLYKNVPVLRDIFSK